MRPMNIKKHPLAKVSDTGGAMKTEQNSGSYRKILSAVAGSTEWFNVAYDGEMDVLTMNLFKIYKMGILTLYHNS